METSVNNKCRAFTSMEQSKKLAEILPIESADMHYNVVGDAIIGDYQSGTSNARSVAKAYKKNPDEFAKNVIPCWSLAALLGQMICPKLENYIRNSWDLDAAMDDTLQRWISVQDCTTAVDACYEMIIKLNEQKLL